MKYILLALFAISTLVCKAQTSIIPLYEEYSLVNEVIPDLLNVKGNDTINIHRDAAEFKDHKIFFSKSFLENYVYPTLGVDSDKVKKLIKCLDFDYMSKQTHEAFTWDFSRLDYKIASYDETQILNKKRQFKISKPIFTKDRKIAFIFYRDMCGYMDCSSTTVKVFKKKKGKWVYYVQLPITIS